MSSDLRVTVTLFLIQNNEKKGGGHPQVGIHVNSVLGQIIVTKNWLITLKNSGQLFATHSFSFSNLT